MKKIEFRTEIKEDGIKLTPTQKEVIAKTKLRKVKIIIQPID